MTAVESMTAVDRQLADGQLALILHDRDVRVEFQPIVHLGSGGVVGYEALLRGPEGSMLADPAQLFAAAERTGRIVELDWIARSRASRAALEAGLDPDLLLLLNIEPIALDSECPDDLWPDIQRGFENLRIVLEVTERSLDRDPGTLLDGIEQERPRVAGVALDDVGTDPATLAMLPLVAPSLIKIDRPIVQSPPTAQVARVLDAVRGQAARTGAVVLVEGIETVEHQRRAIAYGGEVGQGYLTGRPGPLPRGRPDRRHIVELDKAPPSIVSTPFDALPERAVGPADENLVAELIQYVRASADRSEPTLYVDLMMAPDGTDQAEMDLLGRLAGSGTFAAALGPGVPTDPGNGVRGTGQRDEPQPEGQWATIALGPGFCTAVIARRAPGQPGRWEYGITHDWPPTIAAARSLVRLLGAPEPSEHGD